MRVNTRKVLASLAKGVPCKSADSIWTDGKDIYSYGTCIAARRDDGTFILNRTRYSVTTTIQQNGIALGLVGKVTGEVSGLSRGVTPENLRYVAAQ